MRILKRDSLAQSAWRHWPDDQPLADEDTPVIVGLERFELIDFKVRILDTQHGTDATTRVLVETKDRDSEATWSTVGVGRRCQQHRAQVGAALAQPGRPLNTQDIAGGRECVGLGRGDGGLPEEIHPRVRDYFQVGKVHQIRIGGDAVESTGEGAMGGGLQCAGDHGGDV